MTTSGNSDNEWWRMAASDTKNENDWEQSNLVPEEFYSVFHEIYNCYIFSNTDNL